jgi:hypothetical protein
MSTGTNQKPRGPSHPYFDLKTAVTKARALFTDIGRHAVGHEVVIEKLGYTLKSSSGAKALAAMRAFGLLEDTKVDGDARLRFAEIGLDIVADCKESSEDWRKAVLTAALKPKIHQEIWTRYQGELPPDEELKRFLVRVRDQKFSDSSAVQFIDEFRKTLDFAQATNQAKLAVEEVGDDGGDDQESTPTSLKSKGRVQRQAIMPGTKEDVFSLDEGQVVLQWPVRLSKASAQDLQDWLELIGRKIARAVDAPPPDPEGDDD